MENPVSVWEELNSVQVILLVQVVPCEPHYAQIMLTDEQVREVYKQLPKLIFKEDDKGNFSMTLSEKRVFTIEDIKDRYTEKEIAEDGI